jgi:hypothetical protein
MRLGTRALTQEDAMKWISRGIKTNLVLYNFGFGKQLQKYRSITRVNLAITTRCNRSCPNCCCNIPERKYHWDADLDYLTRAADCFKGVERIQLTGGEPTLHPQFEELVPQLRDLFQCQYLTIETNGVRFHKMPELLRYFDEVYATHYAPPEFAEDNGEEILFLRDYLSSSHTKVHCKEAQHVPRTRRGSHPCFRGFFDAISCFKGLIYPCCMGWGIDGAQSVPMDAAWRNALPGVPLPCSSCFYAEETLIQRIPRWRQSFLRRFGISLPGRELRARED